MSCTRLRKFPAWCAIWHSMYLNVMEMMQYRCSENGLRPQIPDAWPREERHGQGSWGNADVNIKDRVNSQHDASTSGEGDDYF